MWIRLCQGYGGRVSWSMSFSFFRICVYGSALLRIREATALTVRAMDALFVETSRCRECRSSCWAWFGQAFSMLNGKLTAAAPGLSRCIKCVSPSKSYPSLNGDAADAAHSESNSRTQRSGGARSTAYPFRPAINGPSVRAPRENEPCVIRSPRHLAR